MKKFKFVICVKNEGFEASLELRKVYDLLPDAEAEHHGMLRVIDESGEDYLFPENFFVPIDLPAPVQARLATLV